MRTRLSVEPLEDRCCPDAALAAVFAEGAAVAFQSDLTALYSNFVQQASQAMVSAASQMAGIPVGQLPPAYAAVGSAFSALTAGQVDALAAFPQAIQATEGLLALVPPTGPQAQLADAALAQFAASLAAIEAEL